MKDQTIFGRHPQILRRNHNFAFQGLIGEEGFVGGAEKALAVDILCSSLNSGRISKSIQNNGVR
jgi:hypothetical protein